MPHSSHSVSTMHPTRLPLSAGSGVEEPVRCGLFRIMAHAVSWRVHEAGIRKALGAYPHDVRNSIVRQGMGMAKRR